MSKNDRGRRLTPARVAFSNLLRKPYRTLCLLLLVGLFSFSLFSDTLLTASLRAGLDSLAGRLGADILIVPWLRGQAAGRPAAGRA